MKYKERERIVERLPYASRVGYIAFCVERCMEEARRHPIAKAQLRHEPLLHEALDMLWARAERGVVPNPKRIEAIRAHLRKYTSNDPDGENVVYENDIALVKAAAELLGGLRLLEDPESLDAWEVAAALEGPDQLVRAIYVDWEDAGDAEVKVIDTALKRIGKLGAAPFSREVLVGISEWKRGAVKAPYAEGRLTGTDVNREED